MVDHFGDDVSGNVLRDDSDPTAARHCFRHASTGNRGHVGHDQRQRRTDPIGALQVYVEARSDSGASRHHEDIGVGQVVRRQFLEKSHLHILTAAAQFAYSPLARFAYGRTGMAAVLDRCRPLSGPSYCCWESFPVR